MIHKNNIADPQQHVLLAVLRNGAHVGVCHFPRPRHILSIFLAKELQHEVTILRRQIVKDDRHHESLSIIVFRRHLHQHNFTLARFQCQVAGATCCKQITSYDMIVLTHFGIRLRKSSLTISTIRRVVKVQHFGSSHWRHRHVARKNDTYRLRLGEDVMKEICHHVPTQIYIKVCLVNFVVRDAIDTKSQRDVVCVHVGLVSGGRSDKKTLKVCHLIKVEWKFTVMGIKMQLGIVG